jgi:hypothetical protein
VVNDEGVGSLLWLIDHYARHYRAQRVIGQNEFGISSENGHNCPRNLLSLREQSLMCGGGADLKTLLVGTSGEYLEKTMSGSMPSVSAPKIPRDKENEFD